jgi:hypothetical protein
MLIAKLRGDTEEMEKARKLIVLAVSQIALVMLLGMNASVVSAGPLTRVFVDDDGKQCATTYRTIQSAIDAVVAASKARASKTVYVCEGTYPEQVKIENIQNLSVIGRAGAVVTPPAGPFTGANIQVDNSRNITIRSLTVDGGSSLGPDTGGVGIGFLRSTGKLTGNTVRRWRTPDLSPLPGRFVASIAVASDRVSVRDNTVSDFLGVGIQEDGYKVRVTHNSIQGASDAIGPNPQYGLRLFGNKSVANLNELTSDARLKFPEANSIGIQVASHQNAAKDNTITGWGTGVQITGSCSLLFDASASHNTVSGNIIRETFTGVMIRSIPSAECDSYNNQNRILNNQIENTATVAGTRGIVIDAQDPTPTVAPFTHAQFEEIRRNRVTHMETWFLPGDATSGGIVSYTLSGNIVVP